MGERMLEEKLHGVQTWERREVGGQRSVCGESDRKGLSNS